MPTPPKSGAAKADRLVVPILHMDMQPNAAEVLKNMSDDNQDQLATLCSCVIEVMAIVLDLAVSAARDDPDELLSKVQLASGKLALRVDLDAEDTFSRLLRKWGQGRFRDIRVFGEERRGSLAKSRSPCVLVDALDGTDLLERGLGNWCSAALHFDPTKAAGSRILAAFVGVALPETRIYYARRESRTAWIKEGKEKPREVKGPSRVETFARASICFYGQKAERLIGFAESPLMKRLVKEHHDSFRVYNLAGNPMLVRLVDHGESSHGGIDAVLEVTGGQRVHDFVAGAFIAMKGGALQIVESLKDVV